MELEIFKCKKIYKIHPCELKRIYNTELEFLKYKKFKCIPF